MSTPHDGGSNEPVATIIPYRNIPALISYYCGVFAIIPMLGALLGPAAVVLGFIGLAKARANPSAKGKVHAWVGIICGLLFGALWIFFGLAGVLALLRREG